MAELVNINITIDYVDGNGPHHIETGLMHKAVVLMEKLADQRIEYTMRYKTHK